MHWLSAYTAIRPRPDFIVAEVRSRVRAMLLLKPLGRYRAGSDEATVPRMLEFPYG